MSPTIGLIQFPGSNCERETRLAVERVGMQCVDIFWNSDVSLLDKCDGFILIGGFSYEDRLRSGVIAALNPIIQSLKKEALKAKPILGICNGAQILMESGLVPGLTDHALGGAIYTNKREIAGQVVEGGYYNDWAWIKPLNISKTHAFTNQFEPDEKIYVPFAHAQGRFVIPDSLLKEMQAGDVSLFQYVDGNPNGSVYDLAAISNKAGNVMAMMPHPERCEAGDVIFQSMKAYILDKPSVDLEQTYDFIPETSTLSTYTRLPNSYAMPIELLIEDNTAKSLELVLKQHDYDVSVKRYQFYEIDDALTDDESLKRIKESAELFNDSKERVANLDKKTTHLLVSDKEDVLGPQKTTTLKHVFGHDSLNHIKKGILYAFDLDEDKKDALLDFLKTSHLLHNPHVQDCYEYIDE